MTRKGEFTAGRKGRIIANSGAPIIVPASLKPDEAMFYSRLLTGRLHNDWSGPDLLRLERLARLFALSEIEYQLSDFGDEDDPHFKRYVSLERLIIVMCRQLHMHQAPLSNSVEEALASEQINQAKGNTPDETQIG